MTGEPSGEHLTRPPKSLPTRCSVFCMAAIFVRCATCATAVSGPKLNTSFSCGKRQFGTGGFLQDLAPERRVANNFGFRAISETRLFQPETRGFCRQPVRARPQVASASQVTDSNLWLMSRVAAPTIRPCAERAKSLRPRADAGRAVARLDHGRRDRRNARGLAAVLRKGVDRRRGRWPPAERRNAVPHPEEKAR